MWNLDMPEFWGKIPLVGSSLTVYFLCLKAVSIDGILWRLKCSLQNKINEEYMQKKGQ